jgi:UDP-N-acetylmuramoyl-tripeptide--D-alanyl-D-alanine ligase
VNKGLLFDFAGAARALGAVGAHCAVVPAGAAGGFSSVCVDSRKAEEGSLFVALKGEKSDGHRFIRSALEKGAAAALASRDGLAAAGNNAAADAAKAGGALLIVDDALEALQKLAAAYLDRFPGLFRVGITGSAGKTTTKEIAAAMIGAEKNVVMNEGNLNSETGLPLSVFAVRGHHEVGIFEAGMNHAGEMAALAAVLRPQLALITKIGPAHIGILGGMEEIAAEKKKIFSYFTGNETALLPEDDPWTDFLCEGVKGKTIRYGRYYLEARGKVQAVHDRGLEGTEITWEGVPVFLGLPGAYNARNALAAASIACELGIGGEAVRAGIASVKPLFGRGEIIRGRTTVIRDCYNANPASAREAIAFCDGVEWKGRRVYVFGSMLELGEESERAHAELGRELAESKGDMVFLYGKETESAAAALEKAGKPFSMTDSMDGLKKEVAAFVKDGDMVLIKGSRGCALEQLSGAASLAEGGL